MRNQENSLNLIVIEPEYQVAFDPTSLNSDFDRNLKTLKNMKKGRHILK